MAHYDGMEERVHYDGSELNINYESVDGPTKKHVTSSNISSKAIWFCRSYWPWVLVVAVIASIAIGVGVYASKENMDLDSK